MPLDIKTWATTSFVFWIIVGWLLMKYSGKLGLSKIVSPKMAFIGSILVGLVVTGLGASLLSPASVGSGSAVAGSSSASALGTINVFGVGTTANNRTSQDTANTIQLNYRNNYLDLIGDGFLHDINGSFTIERTGGQAATCLVKATIPADYQNPSDTTDTKVYNLVQKDSFGKPHVYFDSTTYQEQRFIGFGEGVTSATVVFLARVSDQGFANITQYNSKIINIDVCGQKSVPVVATRT